MTSRVAEKTEQTAVTAGMLCLGTGDAPEARHAAGFLGGPAGILKQRTLKGLAYIRLGGYGPHSLEGGGGREKTP